MEQDAPEHRLEAVLRDLRAAAALVRSGNARSVRFSGLAFCAELLPAARAIAAEEGVAAEPIWWSDEVGSDILIRPLGDHSITDDESVAGDD